MGVQNSYGEGTAELSRVGIGQGLRGCGGVGGVSMWLKAASTRRRARGVGRASFRDGPNGFRARRNDTYRTLTTLLQSQPCQRVTLRMRMVGNIYGHAHLLSPAPVFWV